MSELLSASLTKAVEILSIMGYSGVFLLSFLDRLTVFLIPAEVILPAFGILVGQGRFEFWTVLVWVTIGSFLGNLALYLIFLKGGRPFLEKYGRYILISRHDLRHLDSWIEKYSNSLLFWGYLLPTAIRSLVPIVAGISKVEVRRFSLYTFLASIPVNVVYVYIGMKASDKFETFVGYLNRFNYVILTLIVLLIIWYVYRHLKHKHLTHE